MKIIFLLLLFVSFTNAQFQTLRIGNIDKHYHDSLSKEQLRSIINEIEELLESQLGFNVFDYSQDGKPIDIIYLPPSKRKKRLQRNLKNIASLEDDMHTLQSHISLRKKSIQLSEKHLNNKYTSRNNSVKAFNAYIAKQQKIKHLSKKEYQTIKLYISDEKAKLEKETLLLKKQRKKLNRELTTLKHKIRKYNLLAKKYNRIQRDTEKLSRTFKEIKGVTKSISKTTHTTHVKDGNTDTTKQIDITMQKIEIYDFENLQLLKVILAHEIGHLVGLGHIDVVDALMNPLVQEKQRNELSLTYDDIQEFYKAFE